MRTFARGRVWISLLVLCGCGCGPEDSPPECGTDDVEISGSLALAAGGPACDPCPVTDEVIVVATLSTTCGLVEWTTRPCLIESVSATPASGGESATWMLTQCADAFTDWSVTPDEPLDAVGPTLQTVFGADPIPPGVYEFEVGVDLGDDAVVGSFTSEME